MSYTNVAGGILTQLRDLLVGEFAGKVPVLWAQAEDVSRAPEWIEVRLVSSESAEPVHAFAEVRRYTIELLYLRKRNNGEDDLRSQVQRLEIAQRLQRVLVDNSHLKDGATYVWHDGQVGNIEYAVPMTERADDGLLAVRLQWACTVTEAIG
jgi:hypothetical protein